MKLKDNDLKSLDELEKRSWELLFRGANDRNSGFRIFTLSTVTIDGFPDARNIVLREVTTATKTLHFHTDYRSGKIKQFENCRRAALTFWDKSTSLQLRLTVEVTMHKNNRKSQQILEKLSSKEVSLYKALVGPGERLEKPENQVEIEKKEEVLSDNFCWVDCKVLKMEVLHLAETHTRAIFDYLQKNRSYCKA